VFSSIERLIATKFGDAFEPFTIDAYHYGNVARFINQSHAPNCVAVQIAVEYRQALVPRFAFFALRPIRAGKDFESLLYPAAIVYSLLIRCYHSCSAFFNQSC